MANDQSVFIMAPAFVGTLQESEASLCLEQCVEDTSLGLMATVAGSIVFPNWEALILEGAWLRILGNSPWNLCPRVRLETGHGPVA